MKKLAFSSIIVALAMIGFVAVLWILPHRSTCCAHGDGCGPGGRGNECRMETNSCDGDGRIRKEVRVIVGDGQDDCSHMNTDSGSCPMDNGGCRMKHGDHMMMNGGGCCCCCMMMHGGGGGMCAGHGDSMKVKIRIDTTVRRGH